MSLESLQNLAKQVRCYGIAENLEHRLAEVKAEQNTFEEFLHLLLEDESSDRKQKLTARLLSRAKFRRLCSLEEWDSSYDRGLSKPHLRELSTLGFYANRENLILLGSTGSGKSHLAISLGRRLCAIGASTKFFSTNMLLEEISAQRAAGRYLVFLKSLSKIDVLVLDDFGLRNYTHQEASEFMEIIEERYQRGIIILTSQVKPEGWKSLFEDPVMAEALVDRLTNPSRNVQLKGVSYRTKIVKEEKNVAKKTSSK